MKTFSELGDSRDRIREIFEGIYGEMGTLNDWPIRTLFRLTDQIPYTDLQDELYELLRGESK